MEVLDSCDFTVGFSSCLIIDFVNPLSPAFGRGMDTIIGWDLCLACLSAKTALKRGLGKTLYGFRSETCQDRIFHKDI